MRKYSKNEKFRVMTRDEVRSFDSWAINDLGVPGVVLMENAGSSCTELIKKELASIAKPKVCIFCGTGNNGGDGYVIARGLINSGFEVVVVVCGDREKIKGDAKINLDILQSLGQEVESLDMKGAAVAEKVGRLAAGADMLVDAVFGTGLTGQLRDNYRDLIESLNSLDRCVLAVDIPSGLDCDTGEPLGAAVKAKYTVTFVAVKKGFTIGQSASEYTGEIFVASIGVEPTG